MKRVLQLALPVVRVLVIHAGRSDAGSTPGAGAPRLATRPVTNCARSATGRFSAAFSISSSLDAMSISNSQSPYRRPPCASSTGRPKPSGSGIAPGGLLARRRSLTSIGCLAISTPCETEFAEPKRDKGTTANEVRNCSSGRPIAGARPRRRLQLLSWTSGTNCDSTLPEDSICSPGLRSWTAPDRTPGHTAPSSCRTHPSRASRSVVIARLEEVNGGLLDEINHPMLLCEPA